MPRLLVSLLLLAPVALAPHQVLLLVNENSPDSVRVANHYTHLRGIPQINVVRLDLRRLTFARERGGERRAMGLAELNPSDFVSSLGLGARLKTSHQRIMARCCRIHGVAE